MGRCSNIQVPLKAAQGNLVKEVASRHRSLAAEKRSRECFPSLVQHLYSQNTPTSMEEQRSHDNHSKEDEDFKVIDKWQLSSHSSAGLKTQYHSLKTVSWPTSFVSLIKKA